ncbi:MAG TPA: A/G-specific adenine glycosylase [Bacteroidales bacterium]|nr:A/G-specific adenine glycosylase [Bacteroidales bacterium]HOK97693.1 A/G-specific adenine glycosylase [Bacteroidales bacterium]HPO65398.1 A/G-specific adenine glycosylase [Bacteroidales bacterium]
MIERADFQNRLIQWYLENGRDLPWRKTNNPYHIWICEIILQQTRVNQGMPYYFRFIDRFPDVASLARASEDEVLAYWQGLGYYSRARNLLLAARQIQKDYGGTIPADYNQLLKIKGVGKYTAGAIASMAFNLPYPAIDGNVFRVLSRLFNDSTPIDGSNAYKYFEKLLQPIFDPDRPSLFNQAIIELGALVCLPLNPNCDSCPVSNYCQAHKHATQSLLPVKQKALQPKKRYFYYFVLHDNEYIILRKRTDNDIWKMLYDFPLLEYPEKLDEPLEQLKQAEWPAPLLLSYAAELSHPVRHLLTHQQLYIWFVRVHVDQIPSMLPPNHVKVPIKKLSEWPIPKVIDNYLKKEFDLS